MYYKNKKSVAGEMINPIGEQEILNFDHYRNCKRRQMQEIAHQKYYRFPGCRECVNMIQIEMRGYICGALESVETGESFYVIEDGIETVDYWNCDGEYFFPKPQPTRPVLKRI